MSVDKQMVDYYSGFSYVKDGAVYRHVTTESVLVGSESDLALLTDFAPGTIAFTAGYAAMWQLGSDGTWVEIAAGGDE